MTFAQLLRAARRRRGLSLSDVARLSGVSKSYTSHLESGRRLNPEPEAVARLSVALQIDYDLACFAAGVWPADLHPADERYRVDPARLRRAFRAFREALS